ncbi:MAG: hypothetical protein IKS66_06295 [Oscillospiraceae bacterium]|nr:hypothetical protein [Oscillospiraceae bacterium]
MRPEQTETERPATTPSLPLSAALLQMPLPELYTWLSDQADRNPLLDVEAPELLRVPLPRDEGSKETGWEDDDADFIPDQLRRQQEAEECYPEPVERGEGFRDMLRRQLLEERDIPPHLLPLCYFLVDSLDRRGYLEDSLDLLAELNGATIDDMTQALYALQEMTPPGVGARTLQECLILQLIHTKDFCAGTVKLIKCGLELLAHNSVRAVAALLGMNEEEAQRCCAAVRRLNPIPSRGYDTDEAETFVIPEAELLRQGAGWAVRYNEAALPQVRLSDEYQAMLERSDDAELKTYLDAQRADALEVMAGLEHRREVLTRILELLLRHRGAAFSEGRSAVRPLPCDNVAEALGLPTAEVVRAVHGKYLMTPYGAMELKRLFSAPAPTKTPVSPVSSKERLRSLIAAEDKTEPLTDEKLRQALQALGIELSVGTVANYRRSLGIPAAAKRKVKAEN